MKALWAICAAVCVVASVADVQAGVITSVERYIAGESPCRQPTIVPGLPGLQEGSQAFVDRWGWWPLPPPGRTYYHTWENIPPELVGADYVMTYNDDCKPWVETPHSGTVRYTVTLSQAGRLYLFVDPRYVAAQGNPPFAWLTDGSAGAVFQDSDLKITLHEIQNGAHTYPSAYIYAADVPAGSYILGPTRSGAPDRFFYGIAARDILPPVIDSLSATPNVLWPPNHKMVPVAVSVTATDLCDPAPVSKIVGVTCNEPADGPGAGNTQTDWEITGDLTVLLRAERSGSQADRVYTLTVQCTDTSGNSATATVNVTVPHDQAKKK